MSAKNLEAVAQIARNRFPSREIIIAADFDGHLPENLGALSAEKAAQGIGAKIALPVAIGPDRPALRLAVDFADISRRAACALIEAARKTKGASHE